MSKSLIRRPRHQKPDQITRNITKTRNKLIYQDFIRDVRLTFSGTDGAAPAETKEMQCFAEKKREILFAEVMNYIRSKFGFDLKPSSFLSLRSSRI